jgi:hypothetical protein
VTSIYPTYVHNELCERTWWLDDINDTASRDLSRYYWLLRRELAGLHFHQQELMVLWEVVGLLKTPPEGQLRPASLAEAVEEVWRFKQGMSDTLEVNGTRLLERIRSLSPSQEAALVDALERMWARILTKGWDRIPVLLAEVGL